MKRVLLTGIGGSIGCHVFRHIMATTDWHVAGVDSFRHKGFFDRVQVMLDAHPEDRERLTLITQDLTAPISELTARKIGPIDYIINCASLSDVFDSIQNPRSFIESNVASIITMLEFARGYGCEAFLQISTDESYGPVGDKHLHAEWDPIVPSNPYSASKASQEAICTSYWRSYGVPLITVNLMNQFGEMQSAAKFPSIIQRKVRAGELITVHGSPERIGSRVYIHSRNSSDAFLFLLRNVTPHVHVEGTVDRPDRFNIPGDREVNNVELIEIIAGLIGKRAKWEFQDPSFSRPGHDLSYGLDGAKLRSLGWKQPLPFEESMANTVRWYEENPDWLFA